MLWNSHGAGLDNFLNHVKLLLDVYHPSILIVVETKVHGSKAKGVLNISYFDSYPATDIVRFSGVVILLN